MMIIIITSLMIMSSVGGNRGGCGGIIVFLSGLVFSQHTACPDLLFVMFVSASRKMAE
jgi:hypothetical protein